jgi:hypothetical protein
MNVYCRKIKVVVREELAESLAAPQEEAKLITHP